MVSVINWWPRPSPVYHTDRSAKFTAPNTISRSRDTVSAHQNLNGSRDLTTSPLSWMVCYPWASTCYDHYLPNSKSISTHYEDMKGDTKCRKWGVYGRYGSPKVTENIAIRYSVYEFLLASIVTTEYFRALQFFWDIARYWSKIAVLTYPTSIWRTRLGWSRWNFVDMFGIRTLESVSYRRNCLSDPKFSHLCRTPTCE